MIKTQYYLKYQNLKYINKKLILLNTSEDTIGQIIKILISEINNYPTTKHIKNPKINFRYYYEYTIRRYLNYMEYINNYKIKFITNTKKMYNYIIYEDHPILKENKTKLTSLLQKYLSKLPLTYQKESDKLNKQKNTNINQNSLRKNENNQIKETTNIFNDILNNSMIQNIPKKTKKNKSINLFDILNISMNNNSNTSSEVNNSNTSYYSNESDNEYNQIQYLIDNLKPIPGQDKINVYLSFVKENENENIPLNTSIEKNKEITILLPKNEELEI